MYEQRPTGVTLIAVLFFIAGALAVLGGVYTLAAPIPSFLAVLTTYQIVVGLIAVAIGVLDIAIGWGLWTLKEWSRITAITLLSLGAIQNLFTGVGLLVGLDVEGIYLSAPGPGIVSILVAGFQGWMIWYLLKPETKGYFIGDTSLPPTKYEPVNPPMPAPPSPPDPTVRQAPPSPPAMEPARPARQPTVPVGQQPAPAAWLVLRSGHRAGKQFGLQRGRNTVGRDPSRADILLDDETVSGEHARVQFEQGRFYVYDLASTNGTFVNNRQIQKALLMDGDIVRFGNVNTVFKHVG